MVSYSEWIQEPDYTRAHSHDGGGSNNERGSQFGYDDAFEESSGTWASGVGMIEELRLPSAGVWSATDDHPSPAAVVERADYAGPFEGPYTTHAEIFRDYRPTGVYVTRRFYPDVPADATGIEWQDGTDSADFGQSAVVSSFVQGTSVLTGNHTADDGGSYTGVFALTGLYVAPSGASVTYDGTSTAFRSWQGPASGVKVAEVEGSHAYSTARELGGALAEPIDLAPWMDAGRVALYTHVDPLSGGPNIQTNGTPHTPGYVNDIHVEYGWRISRLDILSTLRPPVYRFVYDAPQVTPPPRRIFPRDDGLTGGAPRTYPPSKGVQSGIRTTGGYL